MKKVRRLLGLLAVVAVLVGCQQSATDQAEPEKSETMIYLVRHGKTWFNTTGQVQGWSDSYLTEEGIELTEKLGESLQDIPFERAYSSDLGRQRNTAKIILAKNKGKVPEIVELDGFKETNFGSFEGKTNEDLWTPVLTKYGLTFDDQFGYITELNEKLAEAGVSITDALAEGDPLKVAETHDDLVKRGTAAIDQVLKESAAGGNVLIVSSGGMIPELLDIMAPGQYGGEKIENCSVTTIKVSDGQAEIVKIADISYQDDN
ncbi:histidine phosphatase family protein [Vagococcus sp. BWB3-3]|uniref:Histidine phosphatase family protein n=1 Tax=Vagococcus allomyrinae TaxID=2794353 RepID=A0A940SV61_9ENTE|nr:histidine phosphatase family protein [Vagococcus allomyrinae]MBP1040018.1 histidine phosphatase family protein [Vagococcus allomyrinae]